MKQNLFPAENQLCEILADLRISYKQRSDDMCAVKAAGYYTLSTFAPAVSAFLGNCKKRLCYALYLACLVYETDHIAIYKAARTLYILNGTLVAFRNSKIKESQTIILLSLIVSDASAEKLKCVTRSKHHRTLFKCSADIGRQSSYILQSRLLVKLSTRTDIDKIIIPSGYLIAYGKAVNTYICALFLKLSFKS